MAVERKDEILGKAVPTDATNIPRYTGKDETGAVKFQHVALTLENPIVQAGMPYDKIFADEVLAASGVTTGASSALALAQPGFILNDGAPARFKAHIDLAGTYTLNVNGTGSKPVTTPSGNTSPSIQAGSWVSVTFSSTKDAWDLQLIDSWQIGDYRSTVRTDLGDRWLLCNGAGVSSEDYPELTSMLPSELEMRWRPGAKIASSASAYKVFEGVYVEIIGTDLYYTLDPTNNNAAWTKVTVVANLIVNDIFYANGYWVVVGTPNPGVRIYSSTSIEGPWTLQHSQTGSVTGVTYANGYWVATGASGSVPGIFTRNSTSPVGTWTYSGSGLSSANTLSSVLYTGTRWVLLSYVNNMRSVFVSSGTSPSSWSSRTISPDNPSAAVMTYVDGKVIVYDSAGGIYYTSDVTSTNSWIKVSIGTTDRTRSVILHEDVWYAGLDAGFATSSHSIDGPWQIFSPNIALDTPVAISCGLLIALPEVLTALPTKGPGGSTSSAQGSYASYTDYVLPKVTVPDGYVYIKAK